MVLQLRALEARRNDSHRDDRDDGDSEEESQKTGGDAEENGENNLIVTISADIPVLNDDFDGLIHGDSWWFN